MELKKLLCVPHPLNKENLFGYIHRLSMSNKYESDNWLLKIANIKSYQGPKNLFTIHSFGNIGLK